MEIRMRTENGKQFIEMDGLFPAAQFHLLESVLREFQEAIEEVDETKLGPKDLRALRAVEEWGTDLEAQLSQLEDFVMNADSETELEWFYKTKAIAAAEGANETKQ